MTLFSCDLRSFLLDPAHDSSRKFSRWTLIGVGHWPRRVWSACPTSLSGTLANRVAFAFVSRSFTYFGGAGSENWGHVCTDASIRWPHLLFGISLSPVSRLDAKLTAGTRRRSLVDSELALLRVFWLSDGKDLYLGRSAARVLLACHSAEIS